jgi:NMD protein affecting ribosome stability and mRNA decay
MEQEACANCGREDFLDANNLCSACAHEADPTSTGTCIRCGREDNLTYHNLCDNCYREELAEQEDNSEEDIE